MKAPSISVIIPTYKQEEFIQATIRSVLAQTYQDYEVIVVDDGSPDHTREKVLELKDDRIHYYHQPNSGRPACARNRGIALARGEYIAFLDGDDLWLPQKLEKQLKAFDRQPKPGLVFSNAEVFSSAGSLGMYIKRDFKEGYKTFEQLLLRSFIAGCTVMATRDCIQALGGFDEDPELLAVEDYELWLRISRRFPLYYLNECLARYRERAGGTSGGMLSRIRREKKHLNRLCSRSYVPWMLVAWKKVKMNAAIALQYLSNFISGQKFRAW